MGREGLHEEALTVVEEAERVLTSADAGSTGVFVASTKAEALEALGRGKEALVAWRRVQSMADALSPDDEDRAYLEEMAQEGLERLE